MSFLRPSVVVAFALPALIGAACTLPTPDPGPAPIEQASDPGPRGGAAGAGDPLGGLSLSEKGIFLAGKDDFAELEDIKDGLGPTLNLDSCGGCHAYPAVGGTSPKVNPQVGLAGKLRNKVPPFIKADGPVREARFVHNADGSPDGGVHALFTVAGAPELYSDLLLHDMGEGLADRISQGQANGREFRTAPLWGVGQRLFFLHDGRAADLREAVRAHHSRGSEANSVVREFYRLPGAAQQDVYNFLRSL